MVGAKGFEPSTSWSRTSGHNHISRCPGVTYVPSRRSQIDKFGQVLFLFLGGASSCCVLFYFAFHFMKIAFNLILRTRVHLFLLIVGCCLIQAAGFSLPFDRTAIL
jgi:hypothetical protein